MASSPAAADEAEMSTPVTVQVDLYIKKARKYVIPVVLIPVSAMAASLILTGNSRVVLDWMLLPSWNFLLRIVGTTIGIGLGLGLATHVHDRLEIWHESDEKGTCHTEPTLMTRRSALLRSSSKATHMEDETSYSALMTVAGYDVSDQMLRGQIVRKSSPFFHTNYPYTSVPEDEQAGPKIMTEQWPSLPKQISHEIGRWIEFIIRDFVASWYCYADAGCPYENEKEKRRKMTQLSEQAEEAKDEEPPAKERAMIFRTGPHRPIPLMTAMYHALGVILGNLASRAEHVNVMSLVLLKWTRVIAHKLKTYRQLRRLAVAKETRNTTTFKFSQQNLMDDESGEQHREYHPVSEMSMTKEFLLAGKLHRAVTFGMDVPSLLFADASGKECGTSKNAETDEQVLEERLFEKKMVYECELDYNRVLGHRLCRAVLPRSEFSSPVIRTMLTELMSTCILSPIMGCFSPDYLNSWIASGLEAVAASKNKVDKEGTVDDVLMRGWDDSEVESSVEVPLETMAQDEPDESLTTIEPGELHEAIEIIASGTDASEDEEHAALHHSLDKLGEDLEHDENAESDAVPGAERSDEDSANGAPDLQSNESKLSGDYILPLLTMAIIDLQRFVDFNMAREGTQENHTNWDDAECQEAVRQVVLVIEAALTHGRRNHRLAAKKAISPKETSEKDENFVDEDEEEEADSDEDTLLPFHATNLSQVLMELTSDVDAFEARILAAEKRLKNEKELEVEDESSSTGSRPSAPELSTLRTLISAWMHTGQVYKAISVLIKARRSILLPFFHDAAFLRDTGNSEGFAWQLRALDRIDIMVDTASILATSSLDTDGRSRPSQEGVSQTKTVTIQVATTPSGGNQPKHRSLSTKSISLGGARRSSVRLQRFITGGTDDLDHEIIASPRATAGMGPNSFTSSGATPRYLDFRRNENFASSLRDERERRMQSWQDVTTSMADQGLKVVHRQKGILEDDIEVHRDLHRLARTLYSGTNVMALRDGSRRKLVDAGSGASPSSATASSAHDESEVSRISLLAVEMSSARRKIEIPDDDSSFLIRAQVSLYHRGGCDVNQTLLF
jgi:hypothetical protein